MLLQLMVHFFDSDTTSMSSLSTSSEGLHENPPVTSEESCDNILTDALTSQHHNHTHSTFY